MIAERSPAWGLPMKSQFFLPRADEVGWYRENSGGAACDLSGGNGTWLFGQKTANELGFYDMSRNVWEWCWEVSGSERRIRGGSWNFNASYGAVSGRYNAFPDFRSFNFGFRLARNSGN